MIDTILNIAKMLLAILPFLIICFAGRKVNLPKAERSKQILMPVIAFVFVFVSMMLINPVNNWLIKLIKNLPKWIAGLAEFSWMPETIGAFFTQTGSFIGSLLGKLNLNFWIFFISNIVLVLLYLAVKKICIKVMTKAIKTDGSLHSKISGNFYEYFQEKDKWCIKENYVQARSLLKAFYYAAIVLSSILMIVSCRLYFKGLIRTVFYPVFGVLVIGELFFFLDGATKKEYSKDILGEDEDAYKTVNYSLLRKYLRSVFGDKLLAENTSINNALAYDVTTDEIIRDLEKNEDQKVACFATFMNSLNKTGFKIDHNYLYSSLDMLNGKSILFNNPFYSDLIPYAFYPMNRVLLSHQKVLVVLGRHSVEDDIRDWLEKGIESVTNIPFLWNIGKLTEQEQNLDIGIITRSDVLNIELHNSNSEFLENVGFVVIIEPSKLITTAQIGLNLLVKKCKTDEDKNILFCMCDKNCDGLVDAMSHILMTSITEVSATEKHLGTSSYMCWDADEEYLHHRLVPNISRYLGMGTELSLAALKNQVSKTQWYGGEAFPVTDIRWIDKQYYYDLTKYASLPTSQEAIDERFVTTPNYWSAEVEKNNYITVEDEACNMFEILRDFSTRTTEQGFINIISQEYLLKDYMADNASIFEADAKAIPFIVADYNRSNRNTILRLILMMSTYPVSSDILEKELSLLGISVFDLKKQLWYEIIKCYSDSKKTTSFSDDYKQAVYSGYSETLQFGGAEWNHEIIRVEESFNLKYGRMETTYSISDPEFLAVFVFELRSAGYIAEDEKGKRYYLGAELCGHVYQKYLPGQFFTFGGKYYEMQYLTADGQVLVRRAADHITGRPTYRQIREYFIQGIMPSDKIGAQKNIAGMKVVKEYADIIVNTSGYYRMEKYNDFSTARRISFEGEKSGIPRRIYKNKEIIRIELPDIEGKMNDTVRYTVTVLFNEVFRTIFAENQAYICAVTDDSFLEDSEGERLLTYSVKGDGCEIKNNAIYIIEDSQLDLGLTVAVERNLQRIFSIIHDYLDWHMETLELSLNPPPDPQPPIVFSEPENSEEKPEKKKGIKGFFSAIGNGIKKVVDRIKGLFKKKKKEEEPSDDITEDAEEPIEVPIFPEGITDDEIEPEAEKDDMEETETEPESVKEPAEMTESPSFNDYSSSEEKEESKEGFSADRKPYHERYYMLYGGNCEPACIDLQGTLSYLSEIGFGRNSLKQAREGKKIAEYIEATFKPGRTDSRYCDFCGTEILGVEYETLSDGRDRCLNCSRTAIKTGEEFRKIFEDVKRNMESFFGIKINSGIKVEMVNSKTLHKRLGKAFIPTPKKDGRILGVAINDKNGYTLLVENGSPRMPSMLTMAHELTHIWQYINWKDKDVCKKYGKNMRLEVYEGMAKWVEIQYAYLINEPATAKREEIITSYRDDEYGRGFLRYRANYPFSLGTVITKRTPFMNVDAPLDPEFCGTITVQMPTDGINPEDVQGEGKVPGLKPPAFTGSLKGPIERNPDSVNRYAYNLLNKDEKSVYNTVLEAINSFETEVNSFDATVTDAQIQKIVDYIQRDHPEIFWFQHGATFFFDSNTHIVEKLNIKYCMNKEESERRQKKIDLATKSFLTSVNDSMSDYEVTLHIYENIIQLVDYDTIGLERQKKENISTDTPDDLRSIYGVFVNKKAVCSGYAKAMQYLLNMCGIECTYVTSDTHAWNLVKLEGDYYHLDVTWGDGSDTKKEKVQVGAINYDCFCITTAELERLESHTPEKSFPIPVCTATKCNYHRRHGLYFEAYDFDRVRAIVCESVKLNKLDVSFKFGSEKAYNEAKRHLIDDGKFRDAVQLAGLKAGVKLDSSFAYSVRDDKLTLAFFMKKI